MLKYVRSFLPIALLALVGGAGIYAWKTHSLASGADSNPPVRHSQSAPGNPGHSRLAAICDSGQPWQVRIDLFRKNLQGKCGEPEIRYLYQLLAQPPPKGELPENWYIIANDLMDQLCLRDPDPQRFSSKMLGLLHDPHQPLVLRDYAVQHLATWINPRSPRAARTTGDPGPKIVATVLQSLVEAVTDSTLEQSTIPGTTLMMLVNISRTPGSLVDCGAAITTLKPWLAKAIQDDSTLSTPTRVSAVQAAGVLAPREFRPALRRIAYQENGQSSLRLPAIAALGQSGDADDLAKLQQIAGTHPELAYAARDAQRTLTARCEH